MSTPERALLELLSLLVEYSTGTNSGVVIHDAYRVTGFFVLRETPEPLIACVDAPQSYPPQPQPATQPASIIREQVLQYGVIIVNKSLKQEQQSRQTELLHIRE